MDRNAAVIRGEMSRTRAALDHKIARLEAQAHRWTPKAYVKRHVPPRLADQILGGALTAVGLVMTIRRARRIWRGARWIVARHDSRRI